MSDTSEKRETEISTTAAAAATVCSVTANTEKIKTPTTDFYKLSREEAIGCVNTVAFHEMFDLETGHMKRAYSKPPSPPTGTIVYEVGTGRPYQYVRGVNLKRIHPDSLGMEQLRREAAQAKAESVGTTTTTATDVTAATFPQVAGRSVITGGRTFRIGGGSGVEVAPSTSTSAGGGLYRVSPVPTTTTFRYQLREPSTRSENVKSGIGQSPPVISRSLAPNEHGDRTAAIEKVLSWKTASPPEPLDTVESDDAVAPDPETMIRQRVAFDMCNCVSLVTSNWVNADTTKPALADLATGDEDPYGGVTADRSVQSKTERLLEGSETLRHLCAGYRNYTVSDARSTVHRLSAYTCRSARRRVYNPYKTIACTPGCSRQSQTNPTAFSEIDLTTARASGDDDVVRQYAQLSPPSRLHRQTVFIDQYMNVFSRLADFHYTLSFDRQRLFGGGGLSNVLVVDKLWTYSSERNVFVPHYQMLHRDSYTETFVNEIRNSGVSSGGGGERRITHIRFLSTPNTVLYTNRPSLSDRNDDATTTMTATVRRSEANQGNADDNAVTDSLPLKKRRIVPTATTVADTDALVLRLTGWPHVNHRSGCNRLLETQTAATSSTFSQRAVWRARNPTLIVFKHNVSERDPTTLLCNILVEMHLGNETRY